MNFVAADILARLEAIGEQDDDGLDIGDTALLLAKLDLPANDLAAYRAELSLIAADLGAAARGADTLPERTAALSQTLYQQHEYQGDVKTYDDPQNANLMRVIDRRKGLPVALGILLIHAARSQGWRISGLNFPGHFLLRLTKSGEHAVIDPFDAARRLGEGDLRQLIRRVHGRAVPLQAEFMHPVSDRSILLRLQNNIKLRALGEGNQGRAIDILQSIILIAPGKAELLAELALLEAAGGHLMSALQRLDRFLQRHPEPTDAAKILSLKERLNRNLN
ncbi:MAG: transglutaminase-like domain-containing protein [Alphaproteobacteria bacterium]